jgi:putative spermidine/putrescine transport system ATP-binding protein
MPGLVLKGVRKDFGPVTAVQPTTLTFRQGELTALLGPSGCGKTTLLRMIAGLEAPTAGRILLGERDISAEPAHLRRFGMVFQSFALFPHMSVRDNVAYSLAIAGAPKLRRQARADELLDLVQLGGFGARRVGELSGGQRQRVAIARALAQEPEVFLLDEPMSALDAKLREDMQVELRLLQQRLGITTIVVTHDQREAMTMADSIVVMSAGRAEQVGPPRDIYHHPASRFVAAFIGKANFLDGVAEGGAIRVGDTLIRTDPAAPFINGAPVTLACRPEVTELAGEGANTLPGEIVFLRDVGPVQEVHVRTPAGPVTVELGGGRAVPARLGERVFVRLPPAAIRVFPRADAEAA